MYMEYISGNDKHRVLANMEHINYNTTYRIMVNCTFTDKCLPYNTYSTFQSLDVQFSDTLICKSTYSHLPTSSTYKTIVDSSANEPAADGPTSIRPTPEQTYMNSVNETIDENSIGGTTSAGEASVFSLLLSSSPATVWFTTKYSFFSVTQATTENIHTMQNYTSRLQDSTAEDLFGDPAKIAGIATVAGVIVGAPLTAGIYYNVRKRLKPPSVETRYAIVLCY